MAKRSRHKASTLSDEDPEFTLGTPHRSKRMRKVEVSSMTEDDYCQPESSEDTTSNGPSDQSSDGTSTLGCFSQRAGAPRGDHESITAELEETRASNLRLSNTVITVLTCLKDVLDMLEMGVGALRRERRQN